MDWSLVLVAATLALAAYIQSATGFGMALVCMAALPLVLPVERAIALVAVFNLFVTGVIIFHNRAGLSLRNALPLLLGVCAGIPLGYFGLHAMEGDRVIRVLGAVLALIALSEFFNGPWRRGALPKAAAFPVALLGGTIGGAFNVGGPPLVLYAYSQPWPKVQAVAVLQAVFLAGGLMRNGLMIANGEYSRDLFLLAATGLVPAALAIWAGKLTLDRLPQALLKRIVFAFILVLGLRYLILC